MYILISISFNILFSVSKKKKNKKHKLKNIIINNIYMSIKYIQLLKTLHGSKLNTLIYLFSYIVYS